LPYTCTHPDVKQRVLLEYFYTIQGKAQAQGLRVRLPTFPYLFNLNLKTMNKFINHRQLIKTNNLESLNYSQRFKVYCQDFPFLESLQGLRDCELVQIWDKLKEGYQLQQVIDSLAVEWLEEEKDNSWDDVSQELKGFLTFASTEVKVPMYPF